MTLPDSNVLTIPFGHLRGRTPTYDDVMAETDRGARRTVRVARLRVLIREAGRQKDLAKALDVEPNYISQLISGKKSFGEDVARSIEAKLKKPVGWLDGQGSIEASRPMEWPFSFDRSLWDRLPFTQKAELEASFQKLVLGASVQEAAAPSKKRREG